MPRVTNSIFDNLDSRIKFAWVRMSEEVKTLAPQEFRRLSRLFTLDGKCD
jgi:hypothetical protein